MRTIGFMKSTKENEKRRALLPAHIAQIKNKGNLYFERGYGEVLGHDDEEYRLAGAMVVSRDEAIRKHIICDPKIGDADYLHELEKGQHIFGWIHAVQNRVVTDLMMEKDLTGIAWEDMNEQGRHVFWRNNELAGEAAIMHAFTLYGKMPYECKVAIIGRGNTARGAKRILTSLGAEVMVYGEQTEELLHEEIGEFDVIVNGILWDVNRKDHIIYQSDLARIKKPAMIVDVSCDKAGAIETSVPTTIEDPAYTVDGVLHYVVDHTPALVSYTVSKSLGDELVKYIDDLIEGNVTKNIVLKDAIIIEDGKILDQRIKEYQNKSSHLHM